MDRDIAASTADTTMSLIEGEITKRAGRPAIPNRYRDEMIDGTLCVIGTVTYKGSDIDFIIDKEDEEKVSCRQWYAHSGCAYIACGITTDRGRKVMYLHNFVMNRLFFPGKGAKESIDHINRNGLDNRKDNLRLLTQTKQNLNQKRRARKCELPEGCGLTHEDIPKHIWYIKASGAHGDRFGIDLKTEKIAWKTTSSKVVPLTEKLELAKRKLEEYYTQFSYLRPSDDSQGIDHSASAQV